MDALRLIEIALSSWYIAYVLTNSHGPGGVFDWLRFAIPHGRGSMEITEEMDGKETVHNVEIPGLLNCVVCLIIWVALFIGFCLRAPIIECIAAAGLGLLLHSYSGWRYNQ